MRFLQAAHRLRTAGSVFAKRVSFIENTHMRGARPRHRCGVTDSEQDLDRLSSGAGEKCRWIIHPSLKSFSGFSLETYFLSAREVRLVEEICSWDCCHGYRGFLFCLIYIKVRFPSVSSNKSGSTTERNGPRVQSDRTQSLHPSWGGIFTIRSDFYKCKSHL